MEPILSFLDTWTPELAWWLGLLYGDGNVYVGGGDYKVSLIGNYTTATRWLALSSPEVRPYEIKRSLGTFQAVINSRPFTEKCMGRFGFDGGRKAHKLVWPTALPKELELHFLRGLWDSDGSVTGRENLIRVSKRQAYLDLVSRYASMCAPFVAQVRDKIEGWVGVERVAITEDNREGDLCYAIKYTGRPAVQVSTLLYQGAPEPIRNERKYDVYLDMARLQEERDAQRCACGAKVVKEGKCNTCWWGTWREGQPPLGACACGKPVRYREAGKCVACYSKQQRALPGYMRPSSGTCACGKSAYRKGMCDACYAGERRKAQKLAKGT